MDGKQLRNSILQWAIQGKLVPQDPNDEPASVLLERIREEKARLVKEKKIKRDKNESIIYRGDDNSYYEKFASGKVICIDDEIPFDLPQSWKWTRLGNVFELRSGQDFPPEKYNDKSKGTPYITGASNIDGNSIVQNRWTEYPSVLAPKGCLLLVCKGSGVGKMCYMSLAQAHIARQIQAIIPFTPNITIEFLRIAIECRLNEITSQANGVIPGIAREATLHFLLPVPPLKEQNRIVEKIKRIDPLVSKYSKCEQELEYINSSISSFLRKSILQEAIQGRLVEQSETDEPASVLLERIKAEKEKLVKAGLLKKSALQDTVIFKGDDNKYYENLNGEVLDITDQIPFDIPASWRWIRLKAICSIATGASFKKDESSVEGNGMVRVLRGGNILPFKLILKPDDIFIDKGIINENILLRKNDLVTPAVTSLENICKMACIERDYDDMTMGGFVFIIRGFLNDKTLAHYLQCVFSSPSTIDFVKSITNKSGQAFYNIGKERLLSSLIPIPPYAEMTRIMSKIDVVFQSLN